MPSYNQLLAQAQQLLARHQTAAAEPLYQQVIALRPRNVDALIGLGLIYNVTNRQSQAVPLFQQALALQPYSLLAHANLGTALHALGRHEEAVASFRQYLTLKPDDATVLYNLGVALRTADQPKQAVDSYRRAVELKSDYTEAWFNLGNAYHDLRQWDDAIDAFQHALQLNPRHAGACNNLGHSLKDKGLDDEAIDYFRRASTLEVNFADSVSALATTLRDLGRAEESVPVFRHYLQIAPKDARAHSGMLLALEYLPNPDPVAIFNEHKRWAERHAPEQPRREYKNDRSADRRLRIGYLSADFREHAVTSFLEPALQHHDPAQVEIFCYSNNTHVDAATERYKKLAHHWRDTPRLTDTQLAALIQEDQIDILVDVSGHTAGNRLTALASRPAPILASYLAYIDTTGMAQIAYRFTDAHVDPPGMTEHLYTENLLRLPHTFAVYRPHELMPCVSPLPALANGHITFGALSVAGKNNKPLLRAWANILSQVPNSRLLIGGRGFLNPSAQNRVHEIFRAADIGPDRVEFFGSQPLADYFAFHHRLDLLLDPFPVAGHTITCHAAWMGVPTVTLAGNKYAARLGVGVNTNLNLPDFIATTPEEYITKAVTLAQNPDQLATLRASLRDRMQSSPLMNYLLFTQSLESSYRQLWQNWLQSNP